ncbi:MAG: oligopeptide/dipeptide ABC transporter ATP-binding protein [Thermodesulfobacteriota bacterium]
MSGPSSTGEQLLTVQGLKKYFPLRRGVLQRPAGWIKAVDGIDLAMAPGQTLGLVGESGCGKSTVGRLVLRLLPADGGRVLFQDQDLGRMPAGELRRLRRQMQIIFQDPYGSLNPRMTVGEAIEEGVRQEGGRGPERRARVAELLEMVGLPRAAAGRYPHEFSGGQRQRVGIARALSVRPRLIVCDEPVSALDVSIQSQIVNLLTDLQAELGLGYLFISHDLHVVGYLSHTLAVMYLGHIMEYGPCGAVFARPSHPYTRALLAAVPSVRPDEGRGLAVLPGEPPSPVDLPRGCRFQGRCPLVEARCRAGAIAAYAIGPGHWARCWKAGGQVLEPGLQS